MTAWKMKTGAIVFVVILAMMAAVVWPNEARQTVKAPDRERGRAVYNDNCTACHNSDPSKDGPLGPALKGSSRALLEYRVPARAYPPGYKPKRNSRLMPAFPSLKSEVPYLADYLR